MLNPYNREHRKLIASGHTSIPKPDAFDEAVKRVNNRFLQKRNNARRDLRRDNELNAALIKYQFAPNEIAPKSIPRKPKPLHVPLSLTQSENILLNSKWGNLPWKDFWNKKRLLDKIDEHEYYTKKYYSSSKQIRDIDDHYSKVLYGQTYFPTKIKKLSFKQKWNYFNPEYDLLNDKLPNDFDKIDETDAEIMLTARHYTI